MNISEKLKSIITMRFMKYGLGVLILGLLIWISFKPKALEVETAIIKKGTLVQSVEEEGVSRVKEKFSIFSPVNGVLRRIEKHAGDKVKKGDVVAFIDWDYKRELVSPITGVILKVHRESAGPIAMGIPILDIGDMMTQEIVSEVLTQEAVKINAGNLVTIEGWGGKAMEGKVRLVEPEAFKKVSSLGVEEQRVRVLIDFITPEQMGEGFKVLCKIEIKKEENRVLVPSSAMFREGENWAVFKVVKGKAVKTILKIETRSGNYASVIEGLQENEEVVLFPGEGVKDGIKIK